MIRYVGQEFFGQQVVANLDTDISDTSDHVVLRITTEGMDIDVMADALNQNSLSTKDSMLSNPSHNPAKSLLAVDTFSRAFPFHIIFNRDLEIIQAGRVVLRGLVAYKQQHGRLLLSDMFDIVRPRVECDFTAFIDHTHAVFVAASKPDVFDFGGRARRASATPEEGGAEVETLRLKGQMIYMEENDCMAFLCSPRVRSLEELAQHGLHLSDIPCHDKTRAMVLMSHERRGERSLMNRLEEASISLQVLHAKLNQEKERTVEVLMEILPSNIVASLLENKSVDAEQYDMVSILYSDVMGFTALCANPLVRPIDVVHMCDKMYSYFDTLAVTNNIYKARTLD
ncbi:PREDICTED: guanylate cyclase soluble subunit beta-1-like [Priapulus caudatus]|uniref:guanylate cyclase n=1 Tax=Priapulus caudatus TaxID=37621 RepID=A0ABM1ETG2_PRICU|nr:PREDICTED: guanylate cyclase soluble subunit beta-1-like [Priapulus caudatus]